MSLSVKDSTGAAQVLATGGGAGSSGSPFVSPAAAGIGATADSAATNGTSSWSLVALLKGLYALLAGTLTATLAAGANIVGKVGIDQTTPGTTNLVQLPATQAGGAALGQALAAASVPVVLTAAQLASLTAPVLGAGTNAVGTVQATAGAAGGATPYHYTSTAGTNAQSVKGSAGTLYSITLINTSTTAAAFVKFSNSAVAPTPGTTAVVKTIAIPQAVSATQPSEVVLSNSGPGTAFSAGIAFSITALLADADTTPVAAGAVSVNFDYK